MRIMPVKPVTHNKYSDMKRYTWIWIMLIALLSGCEDDFDKGGSNPGEGVTEGMITFRFSTEEAPVIVTRWSWCLTKMGNWSIKLTSN